MNPTARRHRREHREFLATHRPDIYAALECSGRPDDYLISIGETASQRLWRFAAVRHMNHVDASHGFEKLACQVTRRARTV
jgi:hypothetical protein